MSGRRRGAILLEILISLALFVTAGSIILVSSTSMSAALVRSRDRQIAADLAATKLSELEAGLTTAERLNDSFADMALISESAAVRFESGASQPKRWRVAVETEPSRFRSLTSVTIRIFDASGRAGREAELAVLHQLVRLSTTAPDEFESDPLLEGFGAAPGEREDG